MMARDASFFPDDDQQGMQRNSPLPGIHTPISLEDLREDAVKKSIAKSAEGPEDVNSPPRYWYDSVGRVGHDRHQWYHDDDTGELLRAQGPVDDDAQMDERVMQKVLDRAMDSDSDQDISVPDMAKQGGVNGNQIEQPEQPENSDFEISDDSEDSDSEAIDNESDASSVPSMPTSPINFDLVYALHTFRATVEGQATVIRSSHLLLLDDSNGYWWLIRNLESGEVGYIPAENIETPWERLARLNKFRNVEHAMPTEKDSTAGQGSSQVQASSGGLRGLATGGKARKERRIHEKGTGPMVTFGDSTYVEHSGDEYSDSEGEDEEEEEDEREEEEAAENENAKLTDISHNGTETAAKAQNENGNDQSQVGETSALVRDEIQTTTKTSDQRSAADMQHMTEEEQSTNTAVGNRTLTEKTQLEGLDTDSAMTASSNQRKRENHAEITNSQNEQRAPYLYEPSVNQNPQRIHKPVSEIPGLTLGPMLGTADSSESALASAGASKSTKDEQASSSALTGAGQAQDMHDLPAKANEELAVRSESRESKGTRSDRSNSHGSFSSASSLASQNSTNLGQLDPQVQGKREEKKRGGGVFGFFRKKKKETNVDEGNRSSAEGAEEVGSASDSRRLDHASVTNTTSSYSADARSSENVSQNLSVLRVFAGGSVESNSTFKTVLLNEDTSVSSLVRQASQRFGLKDAESLAVTVRSIDGQERDLEQSENPLQVFQQLNKNTSEASRSSATNMRRSISEGSTMSAGAAFPAITGSQTNDFADDSAVKIYLHRKGSQKAKTQQKSLTFQVQVQASDLLDSPEFRYQVADEASHSSSNAQKDLKTASFSLPDSVSVAELIESALKVFNINGVVGGGDSVDKQDRRLSSASRSQYGLALIQHPDRLLSNTLCLGETLADIEEGSDLIYTLHRTDRTRLDPRRSKDLSATDRLNGKSSGGSTPTITADPAVFLAEKQQVPQQNALRTVYSDTTGTELQLSSEQQVLRSSLQGGTYRYSLADPDGAVYDITDIIADVWGDEEELAVKNMETNIESPSPVLARIANSSLGRSTSSESFDTALTSRTPSRTPMSLDSDSDADLPGGFPDLDDTERDDQSVVQDLSQRVIQIEPAEPTTPVASPRKGGPPSSASSLGTRNDVLAAGSPSLEDKIDEVLRRVQQDHFEHQQSLLAASPRAAQSPPRALPKPTEAAVVSAPAPTPSTIEQRRKEIAPATVAKLTPSTASTVRETLSMGAAPNNGRKTSGRVFYEDFGLEDLIAIVYDKALDAEKAEKSRHGENWMMPEVIRHYHPVAEKLERIDDQLDKLLILTFGR